VAGFERRGVDRLDLSRVVGHNDLGDALVEDRPQPLASCSQGLVQEVLAVHVEAVERN